MVKQPLIDLAEQAAEQFPMRGYIATVKTVDTVTGECSIDTGDGAPIGGIIYIGRPVVVGQQVLYLTFELTAVVLGGTG